MTPDEPLTDTEPTTPVPVTTADTTTEMIKATVGLSIPFVGGAVGGGSVVVIAITAIFVGVVVLIVTKHCSRQKQNENSTLSEG